MRHCRFCGALYPPRPCRQRDSRPARAGVVYSATDRAISNLYALPIIFDGMSTWFFSQPHLLELRLVSVAALVVMMVVIAAIAHGVRRIVQYRSSRDHHANNANDRRLGLSGPAR